MNLKNAFAKDLTFTGPIIFVVATLLFFVCIFYKVASYRKNLELRGKIIHGEIVNITGHRVIFKYKYNEMKYQKIWVVIVKMAFILMVK